MGSSDLVSHPQTPHFYQSRNQTLRISVQDFQVVNSATVTLHLIVPNPHMLLGLVPAKAKFFTCLDLKDAFFCIHLAPESLHIFAFQWENPNTGGKGKLTWTGCHKVLNILPLFLELLWHPT
jgi:hypothetical protein